MPPPRGPRNRSAGGIDGRTASPGAGTRKLRRRAFDELDVAPRAAAEAPPEHPGQRGDVDHDPAHRGEVAVAGHADRVPGAGHEDRPAEDDPGPEREGGVARG